jgi:LysR family hydrogen peroxide-inducible transcriptional activator
MFMVTQNKGNFAMTLTELRYIVAVARLKHFGKAADECCVSQPTLSVGIRKLEDSLGVTIFERGRSEVKITPIGQAIINQASQVLSESQTIKEIADSNKDQLRNPIRIASTYTIGKYLFPHLVKQAYNLSPKLSLLLNQDYHSILLNKLIEKELDVLILSDVKQNIISDEDSVAVDLNYEEVFQENLYLLASVQNKYAKADFLNLSELNLEDLFILNKQHCLYQHVLDLHPNFQSKADKVNEFNCDSLESLYQIIKLRNGATIVPASFSKSIQDVEQDGMKIIPFNDLVPIRKINLVWRKDFTRPQVIDILRRCFSEINICGMFSVEHQLA